MPVDDSTTQEIWKAIPAYEGHYEVSTLGNIRGLLNTRSRPLTRPRLLIPSPNKWGKLRCSLTRNGIRRKFQVHRLVLETFIGPCPEGREGSHKDGNSNNNAVSNLCWESHKDNEARKIAHGARATGEDCSFAKLTNAQVEEYRQRYKNGERPSALLRESGLSLSSGSFCLMLTGQRWRHAPMPMDAVRKWHKEQQSK